MKKTLLSLMAILAFSLATLAQWNSVNSNLPVGDGVGQISIGMNDQTAMWAYGVDATGLILDKYTKSTDGGLTWTSGSFNAGTGLSQLFAIDATTCWAVMNTGATQGLYKTVNGGTTWVKKGTAYGSSSFADAMHFFNATDGWAIGDPVGGYYEIYTTTDGGETWIRVPTGNIPAPLSTEYGITGDYCAYGDNVWFGTNKGRIYRSTDKGLHWTVKYLPFGTTQTVAPEFVDALHGIAYRSFLNIGIGDSLNVTSDGGVTWQGLAVTGSMYARYIIHIPGTSTYVGSSGLAGTDQGISFSYDGGHNWWVISTGGDYLATSWLDIATGWAGSTAATKKSTGGMFVYTGDSLQAPVANFSSPNTYIALGGSATFTNESVGNPTTFLWTFQGGSPPTSTLQTPPAITYNTSGNKNVTLAVTSAFGTNTLVKPGYIHVGGVGINELNANAVSVFPNPVKDVMMIQANSNIKEIQVYNATGQLVINQTVNAKTITVNTSGLTTGIYNLKAILDNGTVNKKVVIQ
jgi:PKD repeat protein